jgi:hypothetical protein
MNCWKLAVPFVGLVLSSSLAFGCAVYAEPVTAQGGVVVETAPPPERVEVIPAAPSPNHVWVRGHWGWSGREYLWTSGRYIEGRSGYRWEEGRWDHRGNGHVWIEGRFIAR